MSRNARVLAAVAGASVALVIGLAGCGGDGSRGAQAYCAFSADLDAADAPPSRADYDRIAELAPSEIEDDVVLVTNAIKKRGEAIFDQGDEEFDNAIAAIEAYESSACDRSGEAGSS